MGLIGDHFPVAKIRSRQIFRKKAGLTQEQLAFDAQIDFTYASGIERGKRNPSLMVMARIADALNMEFTTLLDKKD